MIIVVICRIRPDVGFSMADDDMKAYIIFDEDVLCHNY